jgi:dihydropyrimidinase
VKVFLAYPELGIMASGDGLHRVMKAVKRAGIPLQVHCEDGELIEALVEEAAADSRSGALTFAEVRPPVLEEVAVHRALAAAVLAGSRVYITHLSSTGAVDHVRRARAGGSVAVGAEACLHHLLLSVEEYASPAAGELLVAPPLRTREHVDAVVRALVDGTLDTVGSDHSQERTEVDERICPCRDAEYGIAGIGARLPLLLSWGLERGVPIERLSHVLSTGPADVFGYGPAKGRIAPGSDGDLVVWDPVPEWTVDADSFHDGTGTSPYRGMRVKGRVRLVSLRGRVLARDGELASSSESGRLVVPRRDETGHE